jgi:hypothetical protein
MIESNGIATCMKWLMTGCELVIGFIEHLQIRDYKQL